MLDGDATAVSTSAIRARIGGYIAELKTTLSGEVPQAQALLRRLVRGRLMFAPLADGTYRFTGDGTVEPVLTGLVPNDRAADTSIGVPNAGQLEPDRALAPPNRWTPAGRVKALQWDGNG